MKLLPRSLFARLMLIWLVGVALVLAVSFMIFLGERDRVGRDALFEGIAQEIAAAVDVLTRLPAADRERWIDELGRRRLRLSMRPPPDNAVVLPADHPLLLALKKTMPGRELAVFSLRRHDSPQTMMLLAQVRLDDGSQLTVRAPAMLPVPPAPPQGSLVAALSALVAGITLLTWLAVRLATRPLSRMAAAARALGEDPERAPMDTRGPTEVAQAAAAFNQMQQRIREHVAERTRILAAISHDLQTPITRLRLRAEMVDDDPLRGRIQSDLDAMQALVKEGLAYARSMDASAPPQAIDLNGLLDAIVDDAADLGWTVERQGTATTPCLGQPTALRRALWNLVENGVKFGEQVALTLTEHADRHEIRVQDHGPGLPPEELEKVFEPFYRTEASRNRETGGTGLGLAIARNLLRAQRGEVSLRNADGGGLEAVVSLPKASPSA